MALTGDALFDHPRLASLYDTLDDDRSDLAAYLELAARLGARLVLETRVPARQAWRGWTRAATHRLTPAPGGDTVENWVVVIDVPGPLITFRWTFVFASDGAVLTSDSTLRFREREQVEADLVAAGYVVDDVRDAPDRPGLEHVFLARRPERG